MMACGRTWILEEKSRLGRPNLLDLTIDDGCRRVVLLGLMSSVVGFWQRISKFGALRDGFHRLKPVNFRIFIKAENDDRIMVLYHVEEKRGFVRHMSTLGVSRYRGSCSSLARRS